jgi:predicted secreted acid phosphatase
VSRLFWGWLTLALAFTGALYAGEPAKSPEQKRALREYVTSGRYDAQIGQVAAQADAWLGQRLRQRPPEAARAAKLPERLTMVIDLDETLLRNWPAIDAEDLVYVPAIWDKWVTDAKAPPIEPVRQLMKTAQARGVDVIILTARRERERGATERNLQAIDCANATVVIYMPDGYKGTTQAFKMAQRERLAAEGRVIILNIGDQESDLAGGFAERTFKLPNPFYSTP